MTSEKMSNMESRFSTRPDAVTLVVKLDKPVPATRVAPSVSICSAISLLFRFPVPSRNIAAVKLASP
jgi:hypothetical protein